MYPTVHVYTIIIIMIHWTLLLVAGSLLLHSGLGRPPLEKSSTPGTRDMNTRGAVKFKPEYADISTRGAVSKMLHNIIIKQ